MVALLVGVLCAGVGATPNAVPRPQASCSLPGPVQCSPGDGTCAPFGAECDGASFTCVCPTTDMGPNIDGFTNGDGGQVFNTDFAVNHDAGQVGVGTTSTPPATGGGMVAPERTGCSFVPGAAR